MLLIALNTRNYINFLPVGYDWWLRDFCLLLISTKTANTSNTKPLGIPNERKQEFVKRGKIGCSHNINSIVRYMSMNIAPKLIFLSYMLGFLYINCEHEVLFQTSIGKNSASMYVCIQR